MLKLVCVPLLITASASMMAFAWIGHLRWNRSWSFWVALGVSWLIVLPEYILNVKATKWGIGTYSGAQMAALHLGAGTCFVALVSRYHLHERMQPRQLLGFVLLAVAIGLIMWRGESPGGVA
jgi:hypothetical protein